jgi:6-pyruvoyltetrahydropterin/6-carboxytetrahydropterin synthase
VRTTITKILSFDSAHCLPDHEGACRRLHGHTYTAEVTVEGSVQREGPANGMVMDFAELGEAMGRLVIRPLDHTYLNDVLDFVPTAEAIAGWMFRTLVGSGMPVVRVRLWETPTSYAEVTA